MIQWHAEGRLFTEGFARKIIQSDFGLYLEKEFEEAVRYGRENGGTSLQILEALNMMKRNPATLNKEDSCLSRVLDYYLPLETIESYLLEKNLPCAAPIKAKARL